MANIRFKLLDDNESSQSNIRFKVIDNNQSNTTASLPQTNNNSLSAKKKKKNKKIVTDVNLPIANNLKNIKLTEESNLPILPLNQSTTKSSVGKDISLPTFDIGNNRTPELPKILPQNVTPKEPSGSDEPSILKTALTGLNYLGQGVMKGAESLMDGAVQVATSNVNPYYWFNQDKLKQHQNIAQELIEKDATNNLITTLSGDENFNEKFLDKDSMIISDNLGGKVVTTIGQMMPAIMAGGGTAANLVLGMQSYGGGVEQAYNEGATRPQANLYGLGNAAIELGTEKLFGGIPGTKSNGWLDTLVARGLGEESFEEVSKSISKEIIKAGYKMVGEAGEEALAEIVNPILKNATYSEGEKVNWNNVLESAIIGGITGGILEAPSNISNIRTAASNQNNINIHDVNNIQNKAQNESQSSNVADSQAIALPEVKYQAVISDNQKINNLRQSASNYFDNTQTTHDLINTIEKVITDKDYNVVFDNAIKNARGESVNALISSNSGQIEIKLNPNSERAGEFLLMHEITHAIETDSMRQLVIDYASKNTQFNQVLENLKQSYGTNDVSDEVLADVSGQLFGNQEFINSLVIENTPQSKSMIRKIYESIVRTLNKLTTNGRYKNFVQELETKWREAYRNTTSEQTVEKLNNETKYMMTSIKGMQNGLSVNNRYQDIKDRYDKALQLETSGQYSNEDIRQKTGWFKDKEGNWEFEISDQHTKFKVQPKANTKYKLPDIFEANTLYEMYPELKNITVEFKNLKGKNGNYNSIANKITINNAMINDLYNLKGTLLHEMQHYIQNEEGLPTGTTILFGNEQYANSKGEIEAADTKNRRNLTVEQRKSIIPESSKSNPIHPNRDAILNHKRNAVEKIAEQIYNIFGGNSNEISEEINFQNIEQTNETTDKLHQENTNGIKELDNSSFSFENLPKVKDGYTRLYRGLNNEYNPNYDRTGLDSPNGYDTLTDSYELAKRYGDKVYYIDIPTEQIGNSVIDENPNSENYGDRYLAYKDDKPASLDGIKGNEYLLYTDHENFNSENYHRIANNEAVTSNKDNQGRTLTKEQQEYFKDSKERAEDGKLNTMYHGTKNGGFTIFDRSKAKSSGNFGTGFYFAPTKNYSNDYVDNSPNSKMYEVYLNITNPVDAINKSRTLSNEQVRTLVEAVARNEDYGIENYGYNATIDSVTNDLIQHNNDFEIFQDLDITCVGDFVKLVELSNEVIGTTFDGIRTPLETVVFNSNQVKNVDNTNPTSTSDIRYSQKNDKWQEYVEENYKATGTRTKFEDIKIPIVKESKEINLPDKEYYLNKIKELESVNYSDLNPEGKKLYNEQMQKYKAVLRGNPTEAQSYDDVKLPTRKEVQRKYMNETDITNIDFDNAKKMSKFAMNRNTAIRLNEKIFGKNIGSKINEKFFYPIKKTESDRIRFLNSERNDIKSLGIKPKSIESSAVQKWGERKFVNDKGEYVAYTETMLMSDVPDAAMRDKVKKAAKTIRNKYDKYLESINNKLTENGYDPIPARDDYFMHFEELTDMFSQIGIPTKVNDLPTDINGVTDQFRPGKQFFANAMRREGLKTTYDAITGIDRYLEGASNVIYHTDDIQRLRTLEKYIRDTYGKENGLSEYENLTKEELIPLKDEYMDRLEKINSNHLSEYASWLQEYTNVLAGKKSVVDRSIESFFGRKVYKYLQFAKKQVGSNMTGFNIGSALTNFISGTQGMAKTNKKAFIQGTLDTIKNIFVKDNFIDKSDFLTTRFGSDKISKTTWEKISNAGQLLMSATDYFTANQIVRSKYHEYLQKGYTDVEAIRMADKFADKLMAGRGKGDMPNIFNSQMLGLVTQFQLEVNNQLDSMFYDTFTENYARNSKSSLAKTSPSAYNALGATFAFGQLLAFAYLFNNEYEKIVGRRPAFDIIDILMSAFEDMEDEEKDIGDVFGNIFNSLADNLPFVSTFTGGGRIPLSSALPNLSDLANGDSTLEKELKKPLYYLLPPTGGGQVKKTIEGLSMFSDDKEITGSYTDSGNLRFPVADTPKNRVQAALFGQYASENAREYFDESYAPLKENQQKQYKELNIPISDYWKNKKEYSYQYNYPERYAAITAITDYNSYVGYNKEISNIKKKYEDSELRKRKVMEYIDSLDLTKIQKAIFKKLNYNSYSNYDSEIMRYIQKYDYTPTERKNAYKALGMYKEK